MGQALGSSRNLFNAVISEAYNTLVEAWNKVIYTKSLFAPGHKLSKSRVNESNSRYLVKLKYFKMVEFEKKINKIRKTAPDKTLKKET